MGTGAAGEEQSGCRSAVRTQGMRAAVTASASEVGITSPVTLRVGPAGTCELNALRGNCGLDIDPEAAVPLVAWVETSGCTDVAIVPFCNCWAECGAESAMPV